MNAVTERPITFPCEGDRLVAILHASPKPAEVGVVVIVGGPQYRAGSHRQFVHLARSLAGAGHPTLRFDARGMGDSEGDPRGFDQLDADIAAAIGALLGAVSGLRRVVLWGLCDGASAALLYMQRQADPRVAGLALMNPWARSPATLARTHVKHYYHQRLLERAFWAKLLSGGVALNAMRDLWANLCEIWRPTPTSATLSFQQRMAAGWSGFAGPILLLISERDLTAHEFLDHVSDDADWRKAMSRRPALRFVLPGADHTCSTPGSMRAAEVAMLDWLGRWATTVRLSE